MPNRGTIGMCLLGGYSASADDRFEKNFTAAQKSAVLKLIGAIRRRTPIRKVSGQNEYSAKACPGFRAESCLGASVVRRLDIRQEG